MKLPSKSDKQQLYDRYANDYRRRTEDYERFLVDDYQAFTEALPGPRILDLGCGPGRDAEVLKKQGLDPLCLDLSSEMLGICRQRGLETLQQNIEELDLPPASFDGVWSYTSLTTIPKDKVWKVLNADLPHILRTGGVLFLGLIEGQGEGWKPADDKYQLPRYISRWSKEEILDQLIGSWKLIRFSEIDISSSGRNTYLHFLLRNQA